MADKDKDVDVSEAIMSPSPMTAYGIVIGGVLPMKTSKTKSGVKYFDSTFTDGKKALRMVSFDDKKNPSANAGFFIKVVFCPLF